MAGSWVLVTVNDFGGIADTKRASYAAEHAGGMYAGAPPRSL